MTTPTPHGATVHIIEPPDFDPRPGVTDGMSPDDLWQYACLVGYRYKLSEHDREQSAQAAIQQAAGAVTEGWRDRLLSALKRAVGAETALRALADECDNDMVVGWEDRMTACIANANRILAASPAPPKQQLCGSQNVKSDPQTVLTRTDEPQQPDSVHLGGGECGGVQVPLNVGAKLFSFSNFDDWRDTAKKKFKKARTSSGRVVCVDQKGRICAWGEHFMTARDEEAFPVDAFLLRKDMDTEAPTGQINPDSVAQGKEQS